VIVRELKRASLRDLTRFSLASNDAEGAAMSLAHRFGIFWRRLVERAMSEPSPTFGLADLEGCGRALVRPKIVEERAPTAGSSSRPFVLEDAGKVPSIAPARRARRSSVRSA
jgi:hypothetical protein